MYSELKGFLILDMSKTQVCVRSDATKDNGKIIVETGTGDCTIVVKNKLVCML